MKSPLTIALAAACAISTTAAPVLAQSVYDQREYERQMREYERQRAEYEAQRSDYENRYNRTYGPAYSSGYNDPYRYYANSPCERRGNSRNDNRAAGGIIGALVGAAIGANVASNKVQTEGAILGAVVGGALGASIGDSATSSRYVAQCDARGYYWNYDQTMAYREDDSYRGRRSGRYDVSYYNRQRCRLAPAPAYYNGQTEYRYVRVCPDRDGRYRITS